MVAHLFTELWSNKKHPQIAFVYFVNAGSLPNQLIHKEILVTRVHILLNYYNFGRSSNYRVMIKKTTHPQIVFKSFINSDK